MKFKRLTKSISNQCAPTIIDSFRLKMATPSTRCAERVDIMKITYASELDYGSLLATFINALLDETTNLLLLQRM